MDFLKTLNARQREAVLHTEGPLLILAGAGSGKTRAIICRLAHLILHQGVAPHSLLAVTFTNKAADEMRERVAALLHEEGRERIARPLVSTFHSFCVRLLRSHGAPLSEVRPGFTTDFTIYDENDQLAAVKAVYREVGLDEKFMKARSALSAISQAKNQGRGPEDFYREATSSQAERLAVVFDRYQQTLRQSNALDFDDLLLEGVRLLQHSREVRESANRRYRYLMVDEYQDTNRPQYDLMRLLVGREQNIGVVGDEDQSIYSWRGADIRNIWTSNATSPTPPSFDWNRTTGLRRRSSRLPAPWLLTTFTARGKLCGRTATKVVPSFSTVGWMAKTRRSSSPIICIDI